MKRKLLPVAILLIGSIMLFSCVAASFPGKDREPAISYIETLEK